MRQFLTVKRIAIGGVTALALLSTLAATLVIGHQGTARAAAPQLTISRLTSHGTGRLGAASAALSGPAVKHRFRQPFEKDDASSGSTAGHITTLTVPNPKPNELANNTRGATGFQGLTDFQQANAGTGIYANSQFDLEPPDQGMCVGNGFVFETINLANAVYNARTGAQLSGPTPLNQFLNVAPASTNGGAPFGPFLSDPKCYFDAATGRWFFTVLEIDIDAPTGNFATPGHSSTFIAVSQTGDPTGAFNIFSFDTTDGDGSLPGHPGCPCLGDQPLIGADANGFYVTTNEFPIFNNGFNGAQVYAISKRALVAGALSSVVQINAGVIPTPDAGGIWFSIQPAETPPSGAFERANGGTEYFLSSLDFFNSLDNRITVWALTNTASLDSASPSVSLDHQVITTETYGLAPPSTQKAGPIPLGDLVGAPEAPLDSNDDRMNQVVFADGKLWSAVDTVVSGNRAGIAYFVVEPKTDHGHLAARVTDQGYVTVAGQNTTYPSIGVTPDGTAVMTFSLVGPDFFPSAAFVRLDKGNRKVHISGAGVGPEDGFSAYLFDRPRWGDYSAAVADESGNIWLAQEYIGQSCTDAQYAADFTCGGTRGFFANFGTFITRIAAGEADDN
ncbi:MAG TPA: hypothetical protein VLJ14_15360 [Ktedonobacterales bacterium]|nr:hypothetical protein [Ktedonobacterales bacterium]